MSSWTVPAPNTGDIASLPWHRPSVNRLHGAMIRYLIPRVLRLAYLAMLFLAFGPWWIATLFLSYVVFNTALVLVPFWFRRKWSRKFHEAGLSTTIEFSIPAGVPARKIRRSQTFEFLDLIVSYFAFVLAVVFFVYLAPQQNFIWKCITLHLSLCMSAVSLVGIFQTRRFLRNPRPDQLLVLPTGLLWESYDTNWFYPWSMLQSAAWSETEDSTILLLADRQQSNIGHQPRRIETQEISPSDRTRLLELIEQHISSPQE